LTQSGKLPYEPQKIKFTDIAFDVVEILKPNAGEKTILSYAVSIEEITVFDDRTMLKTVLRNLVSNALKFTNPGGRIEIIAEKTQLNILISVSDTGIGIKPEIVKNMFNITQMHSTVGTADEKGSGLGLVLCKEFVEKHGGKIWVESEVGKGSTFKFTFPLND